MQVPADMTRFTEAGMRMFATVLLDDRNNVRSEPPDNLFTEFYFTELQVNEIEKVCYTHSLPTLNLRLRFSCQASSAIFASLQRNSRVVTFRSFSLIFDIILKECW